MTFKLGFALAAVITVAAAPIASAHDNGYHHSHQSRSNGDDQLVGGAIGAALRYLTGVGIIRLFGMTGFPLAIITVNVIGSFLMQKQSWARGIAHWWKCLGRTMHSC